MKASPRCLYFATALLWGAASVEAQILVLVNATNQDTISQAERDAWHASFVLASPGNFGEVPNPGTATGTDLLSQAVTATINSQSYGYVVTEGGYQGNGVFPASVIAGANPGAGYLGFGTVNFDFESVASQGDDSAFSWGYDTGSSTPNAVSNAQDTLRFDFTGSATPVRSFSASLLDFESTIALQGYVSVYDTSGNLLGTSLLDWGAVQDGSDEGHQFAVSLVDSLPSIGYIFVSVGDDADPSAFAESFAIGDIYIGSSTLTPEPGRMVLLGIALFVMGLRRCRRDGWRLGESSTPLIPAAATS